MKNGTSYIFLLENSYLKEIVENLALEKAGEVYCEKLSNGFDMYY